MGSNRDFEQDYHQRRRRRRTKRTMKRLFVLIIAVVAILAVAWLVTSLVSKAGGSGADVAPGAAHAQAGSGNSAEALPEVDNSAWNKVGPVEQTLHNMELVAPNFHMIALAENGRVDMSYFDSVVFIGDSLTQGFEIYKQGIPNAKYCAYKGISIKQVYDGSTQTTREGRKEVPMEALVSYTPKNVYIQLGANAMVHLDDESIIAYYQEMLHQLRANLGEEVGIYIQSLTPVRPDNTPGFNMDRINALNNLLAKLSHEEGVYFLDLSEALQADDGHLREDFGAGDGYHLTPKGYGAWVDYLVTHTAYHPENPYLEGSEYFRQPDP